MYQSTKKQALAVCSFPVQMSNDFIIIFLPRATEDGKQILWFSRELTVLKRHAFQLDLDCITFKPCAQAKQPDPGKEQQSGKMISRTNRDIKMITQWQIFEL